MRAAALAIVAILFGGLVIVAPGDPRDAGSSTPTGTAGVEPDAPLRQQPRELGTNQAPPTHRREQGRTAGRGKTPSAAALRSAWSYAQRRGGAVSVAVVNSEGQLRGREEDRRYAAASVVKAMLLAAEIRRLKQAGEPIDAQTDALLSAMITSSDNEAADAIYTRVGDDGLEAVARRVGMRRFTVAGYWGNAQIAAADMALMFGDLERALARDHREYALGLLGSIVPEQSWGVPEAAGERWAVRFKGGWLPDQALAHQVAELRERHADRKLSIAILTDQQPSHEYATATVQGVAERLLERR